MVKNVKNSLSGLAATCLLVIMLAVFALLSFSACSAPGQDVSGKAEQQEKISVIDGIGNEIILEKPAEKIIVFVPSALEIIDGIGAMETVIGVDNWSIDMGEPLAAGLEGYGDFAGINMEKVTEADPDLIIGLIGWSEQDLQKLTDDLGIQVYIVEVNSIEEVYDEILNMGKITGLKDKAEKLANDLKAEVDAIVAEVAGIGDSEKPKVFYEVWNDPLMSAGANTFINELIEYAGGINIVAAAGLEGWAEFSVESLIQNNPDVIIAPMSSASGPEDILSDARFSGINAIINEKVYIVPDNPVSRPSQNLLKGLKMFAQAIHPDIFGQFSVLQ